MEDKDKNITDISISDIIRQREEDEMEKKEEIKLDDPIGSSDAYLDETLKHKEPRVEYGKDGEVIKVTK